MKKMQKRTFLAEWRKNIGFTQAKIAEKLGYSRTYYAQVETGFRIGGAEFWRRLQELFFIPNKELFEFVINEKF